MGARHSVLCKAGREHGWQVHAQTHRYCTTGLVVAACVTVTSGGRGAPPHAAASARVRGMAAAPGQCRAAAAAAAAAAGVRRLVAFAPAKFLSRLGMELGSDFRCAALAVQGSSTEVLGASLWELARGDDDDQSFVSAIKAQVGSSMCSRRCCGGRRQRQQRQQWWQQARPPARFLAGWALTQLQSASRHRSHLVAAH